MDSVFSRSPAPPTGLDCYQRAALENLGKSIEAAGQAIRTVSSWSEAAARDAHVQGAVKVARQSGDAARELLTTTPLYVMGQVGSKLDAEDRLREHFGEAATPRMTLG